MPLPGSQRFLRRLWTLVHTHQAILCDEAKARGELDEAARDLRRVFHGALQKISRDMERHQFNTVVAACMECFNALDRFDHGNDPAGLGSCARSSESDPGVGPHHPARLSCALGELKMPGDLLDAPLARGGSGGADFSYADAGSSDQRQTPQRLEIDAGADEDRIREAVLADEKVARHVGDKPVRKVIVVPGKLVNVVI